eukprot:4613703-Amphidinium_carterae.1
MLSLRTCARKSYRYPQAKKYCQNIFCEGEHHERWVVHPSHSDAIDKTACCHLCHGTALKIRLRGQRH